MAGSASRDRFLGWIIDYAPSHGGEGRVGGLLQLDANTDVPARPAANAGVDTGRSRVPPDHPIATPVATVATRARRIAGLLKRRAQLALNRRSDVTWLVDVWTREHASGWADSPISVATEPRWHWLAAARCLRRLRDHTGAARAVVAMVPAPRRGPTWARVPWPLEATLVRDAQRAFPQATVTIEPFGNARVRRALAAGAPVGDIPRIELDRHDRDEPLLWALTIEVPPNHSAAP